MTKIVSVEVIKADLAPKVPRSDAIQSFRCQETLIVRITDSDGVTGTGYSYTIGTGGTAVASFIDTDLAPQLLGRDANDIEKIWRDLLFYVHSTTVGALTSIALAAVDSALWDLRGLKTGLPLHQLAGGAKDSIECYYTESGWLHMSQTEIVEKSIWAKESGFGGTKIKVGKPHVSEDVRRLSAVRDQVGPDWDIMTDANQGFSLGEAIRRARYYEEMGLTWFEEPIHADDINAHKILLASTSVPIAVGESLYSISQFKDYMQMGACSIVQVDVGRVGGITPWLKVAHMAEAFNIEVCPHFLMELHLPLCCAVPNSRWLEYIPQIDMVTGEQMKFEGGRAYASTAPGNGIDWDWKAVEKHVAARRIHRK
jgi:L-alanine-DL-glutamate epimerase-like enolase superfamily enzyme